MKNLMAPWRLRYLENPGRKNCFLCDAIKNSRQETCLRLLQTPMTSVMLNRYPYIVGHLMVVPSRHISRLADLDLQELTDLFFWVRESEKILAETFNPDGFNIGINLGEAAGAGLKDHLHIHIMPRWQGDTNFVTTCGEVRVIPEMLSQTFDRLAPKFRRVLESLKE